MIGLMKKDFMMIRRQIFIIIALMAFYFIIMGFGKSQDYQIGMFGGYVCTDCDTTHNNAGLRRKK